MNSQFELPYQSLQLFGVTLKLTGSSGRLMSTTGGILHNMTCQN
jgi:hypothetical protein